MRLALALAASTLIAGEFPRTLDAFRGKTPQLDGVIKPGEYSDATRFAGVSGWIAQFTPTSDPKDLSLTGYVKHDRKYLYFAFDVTDDVLYGIDTAKKATCSNGVLPSIPVWRSSPECFTRLLWETSPWG